MPLCLCARKTTVFGAVSDEMPGNEVRTLDARGTEAVPTLLPRMMGKTGSECLRQGVEIPNGYSGVKVRGRQNVAVPPSAHTNCEHPQRIEIHKILGWIIADVDHLLPTATLRSAYVFEAVR